MTVTTTSTTSGIGTDAPEAVAELGDIQTDVVDEQSTTTGGTLGRLVSTVLPVVGAAAFAIGVWYAITYLVLEPDRRFLLPAPHRVLTVAVLDWSHFGPMLEALSLTVRVALLGLAIAVTIGVAVAIIMNQATWLEKSIYPYAVILQTVPILAIVPLIGMWFDFGLTSRVIVCVIIALFPMIANTLFGMQSVDAGLRDYFRLNRASRWQRLVKLQLPGAMPSMMTGLRTSSGLAVIGAIVGDMFFAKGEPGIGTLLDTYRARLQTEDLLAAILLSSLFGVTVFAVFGALAKVAVGSWHSSAHRDDG